ncbi:hypothetical protein Ato02nite_087800 [Paractinoplanes toevensis]|uniref:Uncharacterized protein n=1 Tax=Paractinoplanes toevensis TaxID=571911 RepID=A0A920BPS4_9ACTN|nr:hypothetical protein Ato02nite_087800 [Actinoplanes toevensis]
MFLKGTLSGAFTRRSRSRSRSMTPTRVGLNDTIGPSSVAATGITMDLGRSSLPSTARRLPGFRCSIDSFATGLKQKPHRKDPDVRKPIGTTCHNAARDAGLHSPGRVTYP